MDEEKVETSEPVKEEVVEKNGNNKMTFFMIVIVIVVVFVIGGYFFISNQKSSTPTVESQKNLPQNMTVTPQTSVQNMDEKTVQDGNIKNFTIDGTEFSYTPSTISASVGDFVHLVFENKGTVPHNLSIPDLGVKTKTIEPGKTDFVDFTASKAGTYSFYCTVDSHKDKGMVGTFIVK